MTIDRTRSSIAFKRSQNFRYGILVIISCEVVEIRGCISAVGKKTTVWSYPLPQRYDGDKMVLWHGMWGHRASSCHFRWVSIDGHRFSIIYFIGWVQMRSAQPILSGHKFLSLKFLARKKCCASNGHLSFLSYHHRISCSTIWQLTWDYRICCTTIAQLTWDHLLLTFLLSNNLYIDGW